MHINFLRCHEYFDLRVFLKVEMQTRQKMRHSTSIRVFDNDNDVTVNNIGHLENDAADTSFVLKDMSFTSANDTILFATGSSRKLWFVVSNTSTISDVSDIPPGYRIGLTGKSDDKRAGHMLLCRCLLKSCGIADTSTFMTIPTGSELQYLTDKTIDCLFFCCSLDEQKRMRSTGRAMKCLRYDNVIDSDMLRILNPAVRYETIFAPNWFPQVVFSKNAVYVEVAVVDCVLIVANASKRQKLHALSFLRKNAAITARLAKLGYGIDVSSENLIGSQLASVTETGEVVLPVIDFMHDVIHVDKLSGRWLWTRWHTHDIFTVSNLEGLPFKLSPGEKIVKQPENIVMYVVTNNKLQTAIPVIVKDEDMWFELYLSTRDYSGTVRDIETQRISSDVPLRVGTDIALLPPTGHNNVIALRGMIASLTEHTVRISIPPQKEAQFHQAETTRLDKFTCFGKNTIHNRKECEDKAGVWDRPCEDDSECPFYLINNDEKSGGCVSGYCQLPIGMRRASYRKYFWDNMSYPFCIGCPNITPPDKSCCKRIAFGHQPGMQ